MLLRNIVFTYLRKELYCIVPYPLSVPIFTAYILSNNAAQIVPPLVCRNICQRLYVITKASYSAGRKYCSKCEHCFFTPKVSCECCGMRLRASPMARVGKERVRARRREEKIDYRGTIKQGMMYCGRLSEWLQRQIE